ncbi:hypothetical protein WDW89_10150 [Deltaproteobacteria bacterium TL4]
MTHHLKLALLEQRTIEVAYQEAMEEKQALLKQFAEMQRREEEAQRQKEEALRQKEEALNELQRLKQQLARARP